MYKKFLTLDKDKSGSLSLDEFLKIPQLVRRALALAVVKCHQLAHTVRLRWLGVCAIFPPRARGARSATTQAANPILARIVSIFDTDGNDEVEFNEFISALSTFHSGGSEEKLKFVFRIYDIDGDGFISNGELFKVLKMMVGDNLNERQLQQLVDKTMLKADTDRDGKVSFDEFLAVVDSEKHDHIHDTLTLEMSKAKATGSDSTTKK